MVLDLCALKYRYLCIIPLEFKYWIADAIWNIILAISSYFNYFFYFISSNNYLPGHSYDTI